MKKINKARGYLFIILNPLTQFPGVEEDEKPSDLLILIH